MLTAVDRSHSTTANKIVESRVVLDAAPRAVDQLLGCCCLRKSAYEVPYKLLPPPSPKGAGFHLPLTQGTVYQTVEDPP
jgi:hypothetical protein